MFSQEKEEKETRLTQNPQSMRILVSRFSTPMYVEAIKLLRDKGCEIVYWERTNVHDADLPDQGLSSIKKEFPTTIFHGGSDALHAVPAEGIDVRALKPLDKELIKKMQSCESQVLTMMKYEDPDNQTPVFKKKHIYYKYLKYWYGVLTTRKLDAVISAEIPHKSFQFVLYGLCKLLKIRFIIMTPTIGARYIVIDDIEGYQRLREQWEREKEKNVRIEDLSEDLRAYYKKQLDVCADATPHYMKKGVARVGDFRWKRPNLTSFVKHLKSFTLPQVTYRYVNQYVRYLTRSREITELEPFRYSGFALGVKARRWKRIKNALRRKYESLQSTADFSKKFVYFPLHIQPECTTSAMGDVFVDQILALDILSFCLPDDWVIYVKENPGQWIGPRMHAGRFNGYYDEILKRRNVRLVPVSTSTYDLIKNTQAVASITGTACWEAVLRGKPAFVFGHVWHMYCEGVFRVDGEESAMEAFAKITSGYKPDSQKVLNYLVALDKISFQGFQSERWKKGLGIDIPEEENSKNIANAFYEELTNEKSQ